MATLEDSFAIRDLQERYATESDKNNQDYYSELFVKNVRLRVYFYGELGMQADDVDSMIKQYKAFGAAKASFHQNGQHVISRTILTPRAPPMPLPPSSTMRMARMWLHSTPSAITTNT